MSVAELEAEVQEFKLQLDTVVAGLQADPDNLELQNLQKELEEFISLTESSIAELKPAPAPAPPRRASPPPKEKWSKENHPAFRAGYRPPGVPQHTPADEKNEQPIVYKVNDAVMAKWKSGDKAFYPAKITSITGSTSKPVYIVTFKGYNNTETLFNHEIRPVSNQNAGQKRKADDMTGTGSLEMPSVAAGPPPSNTGSSTPAAASTNLTPLGVISAASTVDPALASAARLPADSGVRTQQDINGGKPAKAPKKISSNKALEGAKSKWQEFSAASAKGKLGGKKKKKESMFRTGEGFNAKVGFIGSGQAMRKDQARTRHIYDKAGDEEA